MPQSEAGVTTAKRRSTDAPTVRQEAVDQTRSGGRLLSPLPEPRPATIIDDRSDESLTWQTLRGPEAVRNSAGLTSEDLNALTHQGSDQHRVDHRKRLLLARGSLDWDKDFQQRYELHQCIGQGGSGDVFLGIQRSLDRAVAIKVGGIEGGSHAQRFRAEAFITAYLEHPNIVPVYDAGDCYIAMKQVRGESFHHWISRQWPQVDIPGGIEIIIKVCDALAYAHDHGVVHRDIKASNVMVGDYGEVLLLDWGLAAPHRDRRLSSTAVPQTWRPAIHLIAGTPGCMPPEVAAQREADAIHPSCDVFCLGAMLYELLTARLPFLSDRISSSIAMAASNDFPPIEQVNPQAPKALIAAQCRAMHTDPQQRPTVPALREHLRAWLLRSGNEIEARASMQEGRQLLRQARECDRRAWAQAFPLYNRAVAAYDRALHLCPDLPDACHERQRALRSFSIAALRSGNLQLARLLTGNRHLPVVE